MDKSSKMDLRSGNKSNTTKLSEAELKIIQDRMVEQKTRMTKERQTMLKKYARFEREKEGSLQKIREEQKNLSRRENELRKWEMANAERYDEQDPTMELSALCREVRELRNKQDSAQYLHPASPLGSYNLPGISMDNCDKMLTPKLSFREALKTTNI